MRLFGKVQCPLCQGDHCRKSRWHSSEEKWNNLGYSPYRCLDCSHRFLTPHTEKTPGAASILMAVLIVGVVSAMIAVPLLTDIDPSILPNALGGNVRDDAPKLRRVAENGDPATQFKLGKALFEDSARTDESSVEAIRWLEAAAKGGSVESMVYLGRLLQSGVGILQDFEQAFLWFRTAATLGSSEGMLETGRMYRDGVGVGKDPVAAYVWFNRAAAARNIDAVREREATVSMLTPDELKEAQQQSSLPERKGDGSSPQNARD